MKKGWVRVTVKNGMFAGECSVSVRGVDRSYEMIVDSEDVDGGRLEVGILNVEDTTALITLPRDTFASGSTVRVPRGSVEDVR